MCGRLSLFAPIDALEERFGAEAAVPIPTRYNVAPGEGLAAIRNDAPDRIDLIEWGLLPSWVDDPDEFRRPINARAETVDTKPSFRDAFDSRRCLVLADGFYEWAGERGSRRPYRIERTDGEPFAMAGLWERHGDDGDALETAAIVTTDANGVVGTVHDRMPVVLSPDEEARWLEAGDADARRALLDPFPDDELEAFPVSTALNDPTNDGRELIEEADVGEQSGLSEFS